MGHAGREVGGGWGPLQECVQDSIRCCHCVKPVAGLSVLGRPHVAGLRTHLSSGGPQWACPYHLAAMWLEGRISHHSTFCVSFSVDSASAQQEGCTSSSLYLSRPCGKCGFRDSFNSSKIFS